MDLKHQVKQNWKVVVASAAAFAIGSASLGVANAGDDGFGGMRPITLHDRVQVSGDDTRESGVPVITAQIESLNDSPDADDPNGSPATGSAEGSPDLQVADDSPDTQVADDSPDTQVADDSPDTQVADTQAADSPDEIDSPDNS